MHMRLPLTLASLTRVYRRLLIKPVLHGETATRLIEENEKIIKHSNSNVRYSKSLRWNSLLPAFLRCFDDRPEKFGTFATRDPN
jgi:hypothetical protein